MRSRSLVATLVAWMPLVFLLASQSPAAAQTTAVVDLQALLERVNAMESQVASERQRVAVLEEALRELGLTRLANGTLETDGPLSVRGTLRTSGGVQMGGDLALPGGATIYAPFRLHITAVKTGEPEDGRLFLNPWTTSGDVYVGGGGGAHSLEVSGGGTYRVGSSPVDHVIEGPVASGNSWAIRYSSGVQVCWGSLQLVSSQSGGAMDGTVCYARPFKDPPSVSVGPPNSWAGGCPYPPAHIGSQSASCVGVVFFRSCDSTPPDPPSAGVASFVAIGFWK